MEFKDWVLAVGVIVTFIMGISNLYFNFVTSRKTSFVNTVTAERVKWIGKIRENMSRLVAEREQTAHENTDTNQGAEFRIRQLRNEILLQLNPVDDAEQIALIENIGNCTGKGMEQQVGIFRRDLIRSTQAMLKREWDKVKRESVKGGR